MDELLRHHGEQDLHEQAEPLLRATTAMGAALNCTGTRLRTALQREDGLSYSHPVLAPLVFLATSALVGALLTFATFYTLGYTVTVDGQSLGTVQNPSVYTEAVQRVESKASNILGYSYTLDQTPQFSRSLTEKDELTPAAGFESFLFGKVDEIISAYVLRVDGQMIGAAPSEGALTALLSAVSAPYENESTTSTTFLQKVSISQEDVPANVEQNVQRMTDLLTANTNGETQYTVQKGDTFMQIAYDNDMDMADLQSLNPQQDIDKLFIGDVLTVRETIPFLSVRTIEHQVYPQALATPIIEVEDSTMYKGESKILVEGSEGQAIITADVVYENGNERERTVLNTEVLTEPTAKQVAVGTMERPSWLPTGHFTWPTWGTITSRFGSRYIFGSYSYHSGIDISVPYGSSIKAADGGTVIFAGTGSGSTWSYGKYVVIDHGNGRQTYYAHNSSLLVSVGDKVYQGQVIARAGSTGRSTGPHCHFQVKINGSDVNPLKYLP